LKILKNGRSEELTSASLSSWFRLATGPAKSKSNCCFEAATRRRALAEPETLVSAVDVEVVDDANDVEVLVVDDDDDDDDDDDAIDDFVVFDDNSLIERNRKQS
jgi:hypothetical protein